MELDNQKCPTCLGTGRVVRKVYVAVTPEVRKKARKLFREGYSYRVIGKMIGVKHPQSVKSLINAKI